MTPTLSKSRLVQSLATVSGALAATAASTQASTVQITLAGNMLSSSSDALNADMTGDGINDLIITGVFQNNSGFARGVGFNINGQLLFANYTSDYSVFRVDAQFAEGGAGIATAAGTYVPQNISYLNPINFTDARINGGASTQGYLQVNAFNDSWSSHTIQMTRLVFDDASTTLGAAGLDTGTTYTEFVPEPSSLGLLALGAGGLLARRRRQAA